MESKWYYAENRQQKGPVSGDELKALLSTGKLSSDILVWHAGMTTWQAAANFPELWKTANLETVENLSGIDPLLPPQDPVAIECFPAAEFPQSADYLSESAAVPALAGLWRRFWAMLLDDLIFVVIMIPISMLFVMFAGILQGLLPFPGFNSDSMEGSVIMLMVSFFGNFFASLIVQFLYSGFFLSRYGATPGKMALGIQVVRSDGSRVSFLRGGSRFLATKLSAWLLFIGYLIAFFDDQKRTLHDHLCDTRVELRGR